MGRFGDGMDTVRRTWLMTGLVALLLGGCAGSNGPTTGEFTPEPPRTVPVATTKAKALRPVPDPRIRIDRAAAQK